MRSFLDVRATRQNIYEDVLRAAQELEPTTDGQHTLRLTNPRYVDPEKYTRKQQKEALLLRETLGRRLKGTWELLGPDGQVLDRRDQIVASVPFMTHRGTFIYRGTEYQLRNQQRLRPGMFARRKANDELEVHANVLPSGGVSHHYLLNPAKRTFHLNIRQANLPLLPLLQAMGATDREMREAWGNEVYAANYAKANDASAIKKLAQRILSRDEQEGDEPTQRQRLVAAFARMQLDPDVNQRTLGKPFTGIDKDAILTATKKLLAINRGDRGPDGREIQPDNRDSLPFQQFLGPEDLFSERIRKDHGRLRRQLLRKMVQAGNLAKMPSGALTPQLEHVLLRSGLGQPIEEINTAELLDKLSSVTRMGEGSIQSLDAIPDEARDVHSSQFNVIDPIRTPESLRAGIDLYFSRAAMKGRDGKVYAPFRDLKTGQTVYKTPQEAADLTIATPDAFKWPSKRIPVIRGGELDYAPRDQVHLQMPSGEDLFSPVGNLVPIKSASKQHRMAMAARMLSQALPLVKPEAPLVQGAMPGSKGSRSFEEEYAKHMGAVFAEKNGRVANIKDGIIQLKFDDGGTDEVELYDHFPLNRKTFLHQTPLVRPGDVFTEGQPLARSNFTDKQGTTALGTNVNVAYWPYMGYVYEDAIVVSEDAAREKFASESAYPYELEIDDKTRTGKRDFIGTFPGKFDRAALTKLDDRGVVKVGETVEYGQPLILAAQERPEVANKIHKKRQAGFNDQSVLWDHHDRGLVTDVRWGKAGPVVIVKAVSSLQVGDKLSGRYGDKGVVAAILPTAKMPHDKSGRPFDVLLSPTGITSRTNESQVVEAILGKIARVTGKPIKVPDFEDIEDVTEWAHQQLRQKGLRSAEDLYWPEKERRVPNVLTGNRFMMKLHHTSESKLQARDSGAYSADETPAKGGASGSKRIALLDTNALLSHGAFETLRDAGAIRGQPNEEMWLTFLQGNGMLPPKVPRIYEKFIHYLKGSGINAVRQGTRTRFMAMTDRDVDELAGNRNLANAETVSFEKDMTPVPGGLFDSKLTGGHNSKTWTAIKLAEPMLNPVMEDPARYLLGLTKKELEGVIGGQHELPRYGSGPEALAKALDAIDVKRELNLARAAIKSGRASYRDQAVRKLGYLKAADKLGIHPRDWILHRAPVLPTLFRPVSVMGKSGIPLVSDPNYLYRELFQANDNLLDMKKDVGEEGTGPERLALYHAFKAVTGLGDPVHPKLVEKNVRGLLHSIFGGSSPKYSMLQRKLLSATVDQVGRGVVVPNPDYDIDTIGIPEDSAFDIYKKFVVRRLRRRGMNFTEALKAVKERTDLARSTLLEEMGERPVVMNRAPVLHKFGIMAFKPQLVKGSSVQVSPLIVKGYNMDFDGDAVQFHVPGSNEAKEEALERLLPSKNLLSTADFKRPMHVPGQEYLAGLFAATSPRLVSKRRPRIFRSRAEVLEAYKRNDIDATDRVDLYEER